MEWPEVIKAAYTLSNQISSTPHAKDLNRIVCIGRGGMVLSRILSGALGINRIYYQEASREKEYLVDVIHDNSIFVDDILDTGKTFERFYDTCLARDHDMRKIVFAFLVARDFTLAKYLRSQTVTSPLYVGEIVDYTDYIQFPWEEFDRY